MIIIIIIGCFIGFSFAYMITSKLVLRSNNHGDSKGTFQTFSVHPLDMCRSENDIPKPPS